MARLSVHLSPMIFSPRQKEKSRCSRKTPAAAENGLFVDEIAVIFRNLDGDVFVAHHGLAGKARFACGAEGVVELIVLVVGGLTEALKPLLHNHVAGRAGAVVLAGVRQIDARLIEALREYEYAKTRLFLLRLSKAFDWRFLFHQRVSG